MTGAPGSPAYQPRRRRWIVWHLLLSLVIFAAGVATGTYGYMAYREKQSEERLKHPELAAVRFADKMADRLDLSGQQARQFREIFQEEWPEWQKLRAEMYPRMKVQMDRLRARLAPTLQPEQLAKFDAFMADMAKSMQYSTSQASSAPSAAP